MENEHSEERGNTIIDSRQLLFFKVDVPISNEIRWKYFVHAKIVPEIEP